MRLAFERRVPAAGTVTGAPHATDGPSPVAEGQDGPPGAPAPGADGKNPPELVEIVTPRTNAAAILPAENLLAAISLHESFSLEIAGTRQLRWFLARAA